MKCSIATIALLLCATGAHAASPELEGGVYIYNGASMLQVQSDSTPTVVDWNNDGRKDLIVGQYTSGKINLFLNQGTDANPVFNGGSFIQSGGVDITMSYG